MVKTKNLLINVWKHADYEQSKKDRLPNDNQYFNKMRQL